MTDAEPLTPEQSLEYAFYQESTELRRDRMELERLELHGSPDMRHDKINLMGSVALHFAECDSILDEYLDHKKEKE